VKQERALLIIQEILPSYRVPVFDRLAQEFKGRVTLLAGNSNSEFGSESGQNLSFKLIDASWVKLLGMFKYDFQVKKLWSQHDIVLHVADFKFLSLWLLLFKGCFTDKKLYLHGQGGYKKSGFLTRLVYFVAVFLCEGYICYTNYSKDALMNKLPKFLHRKISVCNNTLDIEPVGNVPERDERNSIFYIGRLRAGCEIEILLEAAIGASVKVEVIGAGCSNYLESLKNKYSAVATFHGAVFDEKKQKSIARNCMAGAYGGDAGLSVVHYMALGLPVIVHSDIDKHMGPEPSYVVDGVNGLNFTRNDVNSLTEKLKILVNDKGFCYRLAVESLDTFRSLGTPSMGERLAKILGSGE